MSDLRELSWAEKLALIEAYSPTNEQIFAAFDIDEAELTTALDLQEAGTLAVDTDIDISAYADAFDIAIAEVEDTDVTEQTDTVAAPVTATKAPAPAPKKRGRKGTKIAQAFDLIDTTPVDANAFAASNDVSLNVLRQAKRFDPYGERGRVRVKKIEGTLSIFRDAAE